MGFTLWLFLNIHISVWLISSESQCDSFGLIARSPLFVYFAPFIHTMFTLRCCVVMTVAGLIMFWNALFLKSKYYPLKWTLIPHLDTDKYANHRIIRAFHFHNNTGSGQTLWPIMVHRIHFSVSSSYNKALCVVFSICMFLYVFFVHFNLF